MYFVTTIKHFHKSLILFATRLLFYVCCVLLLFIFLNLESEILHVSRP